MQGPRHIIDPMVEAHRRRAEWSKRDPLDMCRNWPAQREMVEAVLQPGARIADHSGRGSGKTQGLAVACQAKMRQIDDCRIAWIGLTRKSAMDNIWLPMRAANRELGNFLDPKEYEARWYSPAGGVFSVFGARSRDELEKLRGQTYHMAVIDESASFPRGFLRYLVESILEPRLIDHDGSLAVIGSPGFVPKGYYHRVCQGSDGYQTFRRTMLDNPFIPNARERIEAMLARKGWDESHPTYMRETLGLWVRDQRGLVFDYSARNLIPHMPEDYHPGASGWNHLLAVDFGVKDSTAWVVLAWRRDRSGDTKVYVVESFKWHSGVPQEYWDGLGVVPGGVTAPHAPGDDVAPSDVAVITQRIQRKYRAYPIVGDLGGMGAAFETEARRRFGLRIQAADKKQKMGKIELVNDAFRTGQLVIVEGANDDLIEELLSIQWKLNLLTDGDDDEDGSVRLEDLKVDDKFENHLADALQYGFTEAPAYRNTAPKPKPAPTPEDSIARHRKEQFRKQRARAAGEWWQR